MKTKGYNFERLGRRCSALHRDLKAPGNSGFVDEGAEAPPAANKAVSKAFGKRRKKGAGGYSAAVEREGLLARSRPG